MPCPNCRAENPAGTSFCSQCGTALVPAAAVPPPVSQFSQPVETRLSGFALASLICGICLLWPLGIVFGILGLMQTSAPQNRLHGRGLAVAGLIVSVCVIPVIAIFAAVLFPVFGKARSVARSTACINDQRQLAIAINMYAQDHNDKLPTSFADLNAYTESAVFKCPQAPELANGYGLNAAARGVVMTKIPNVDEVLLTADSDNPSHLLNSPADIAYRHDRDMAVASYLDGHVQQINRTQTVDLKVR